MDNPKSFFDLQVNGYGGIDFNQDELSFDAVETACRRLASDGVDGVLATIITEDVDIMAARIARLAELMQRSALAGRILRGIHVEGPFISATTGYRGAHPVDAIRPAELDAAKRLLDAGAGLVRIVTLAPECDDGLRVTRWLAEQGVCVSAGHCDPNIDQLKAAIDAGVTMFTHVGNGCPMQLDRHDNIVQRVLNCSDRIWCCFIGDGVHVPFFALRNYIRAAGVERSVVVTDALAPAGLGPGSYTMSRWRVDIGDDLAAWAPDRSHLLGSACTMSKCASNLSQHCRFSDTQVALLTTSNPRRAINFAE